MMGLQVRVPPPPPPSPVETNGRERLQRAMGARSLDITPIEKKNPWMAVDRLLESLGAKPRQALGFYEKLGRAEEMLGLHGPPNQNVAHQTSTSEAPSLQ